MGVVALGIYYWSTYFWFVVGFILIAIPAILEIRKMLKNNRKREA